MSQHYELSTLNKALKEILQSNAPYNLILRQSTCAIKHVLSQLLMLGIIKIENNTINEIKIPSFAKPPINIFIAVGDTLKTSHDIETLRDPKQALINILKLYKSNKTGNDA